MITLRPILAEEFPAFEAYFITDYAAEIAANFGTPLPEALTQARYDLANYLPQGASTLGENLMCIILEDQVIGYLFYRINADTKSAFIGDFHVLPPFQRQGYGTAALAVMETLLKPQGITQIRLRVAAQNPRAHQLYQTLGFFVTGTNMAKQI